jgi:uncharacterized membrane protein
LWVKHTLIVLGILLLNCAAIIAIVFGLFLLGKTYGTIVGISTLALAGIFSFTYAYSLEKLQEIEKNEEKLLYTLKTDYSDRNNK